MKIVHVVESLDRGGLERVVCDLAQAQSRAGHEVSIVCLFNDGLLADEARMAGLQVETIAKRPGIDLAALIRLRRALRSANPDVVHTHNATAHYCSAASSWPRRQTIVNTRHGMGGSRRHDRRERLFALALGKTAAVATVCKAAAKRFVADGIVPSALLRVVPNGIRLQLFENPDRVVARRRLAVPADTFLVGTVGRLNRAKDHAFLLLAFREVAASLPAALLAIIGEGEEREALVQQAANLGLADKVKFLGDRPDVPHLLPGFDVFAISSRTEGYSIAILEACAAGVPVVATDVGGNGEIVENGVTGFLVAQGSLPDFSRAIRQLAASAALRVRLGGKAREWAITHASLEAMASCYERTYADCLAGAQRAADPSRWAQKAN